MNIPCTTETVVEGERESHGRTSDGRLAGAAARNSSFVLLVVAMLAIGLDVGVARITYFRSSRATCNSA
jgi:hypothetical protein